MGKVYASSGTDSFSTITNKRLNDYEITKFIQSQGLYSRSDNDVYEKFNRFGVLDPYNQLGTSREYIFITKPDLHLFEERDPHVINEELSGIPFFNDALIRYPYALRQLQISYSGNPSPFMNIITNSVKSSMDLSTISADTNDTGATYQGFAMKYREDSFESDFNHSFSLEINDTKYLECYMVFKIWDMYERVKKDGDVTPPDEKYIINRILHDQCAVYKFIVDEDGESIIYYAKGWGVFPKNVPRDMFGNLSENTVLTMSVDFNCTLLRDMDPLIISDFNKLVNRSKWTSGTEKISIYNDELDMVEPKMCKIPYIDTSAVDNKERLDFGPGPRYKLKWRG